MSMKITSWSNLPRELVPVIANYLHSDLDLLCMRATCRPWFILLPKPPLRSSPPQLPVPGYDEVPSHTSYLQLVHSTIYCLQPLKIPPQNSKTTRCWLIRTTSSPSKIHLKDPLSVHTRRLPKSLNLLDYKVSEVTRVYDLQFVDFGERFSVEAKKVAVCSEGPAFSVMAIFKDGRLGIWTEGDNEWTPLANPQIEPIIFNDAVYRKGKFYARDIFGGIMSVNISSKQIEAQISSPTFCFGDKRLLSYRGDLFVLDMDVVPDDPEEDWRTGFSVSDLLPTRFRVYRWIDGVDSVRLDEVLSLGDTALFVGENWTFGVSSQKCAGGCKNNCIYCLASLVLASGLDPPASHCVLFDMEDSSARFLSNCIGYSGLFWPPPSWLVW